MATVSRKPQPVEVTPEAVRIRKVILNSQERFRENARRRRAEA